MPVDGEIDPHPRRNAIDDDALAREGRAPRDASLEEMEALWQSAKAAERQGQG